MLFVVFALLLTLAAFLLWLGYAYDAKVFQLVSLFFLFILGLHLMGGSVLVKTGFNETLCQEVETYIYGNNFTYANGSATYHWDYDASGVPPQADRGVFLFHKVVGFGDKIAGTYLTGGCVREFTDVYEPLDDAQSVWFGRFLAFAAALSLIYFFFTLKTKGVGVMKE